MDQNLRQRFGPRIWAVILLCLGGTAISSYLLYFDFMDEGDRGMGSPIGVVERAHAKVRRRAAKSYLWTFVDSDSPLFNRDSIQAAEESSATIRLRDGSELEVGENSLVVMDSRAQLSLQFLRGTFTLRKNESDSLITVGNDGKPKVQTFALRLVTPRPHASVVIPPSESTALVKFAWSPTASGTAVGETPTLEISKTADFPSRRTQTFPLKDKTFQVPLEPGRYFWRVVSKGVVLSETRRLELAVAKPLIPLSPAGGEMLRWEPRQDIPFRWSLPDTLGSTGESPKLRGVQASYDLEVAKDPDFRKIVKHEKIAPLAGGARLAGLGQGEFYWRIQSRYHDLTLESRAEPFSLSTHLLDNQPLVIVSPANEDKLYYWQTPTTFPFRWNKQSFPEGGGYAYRLEIARDPAFQTGRIEQAAKENSIPSQSLTLTPADYFWRVHVTDANGKTVKTSSVAKFTYGVHPRLAAPKSLKPKTETLINLIDAKKHPALSWEAVPDAVAYVVTVKSKEKNKVVFHKETKIPNISFRDLPVGYYEWTVSAIDLLKRPGEAALWTKFSASYGGPLSAPRVLTEEVQ